MKGWRREGHHKQWEELTLSFLSELLHSLFSLPLPPSPHHALTCMWQRLPELLRHKRHEGVQQPQCVVKHIDQHGTRSRRLAHVCAVRTCLAGLYEPVGELVPEERVSGDASLEEGGRGAEDACAQAEEQEHNSAEEEKEKAAMPAWGG